MTLTREQFIARAIANGFPEQLIERSLKICSCSEDHCPGWMLLQDTWHQEDFDLYDKLNPFQVKIEVNGERFPPFGIKSGKPLTVRIRGRNT